MDSEQIKVWVEKAWHSWLSGLVRRRLILVLDMFEACMTDMVKSFFQMENTDLAGIPGGLTSFYNL